MTMFDLALPRRVLFGPGRATELAGLLPGLGRRVLLYTGRDASRHAELERS
jgi:alcohol dehydrogenase YqhD (iron-dependent ADH family)